MYVVEVRIVVVVMQDAFQICAVQHCDGAPAAPAAVYSLTLAAHFHKTIPLALRYVSLSHHVISLNTTGLSRIGSIDGATRSTITVVVTHHSRMHHVHLFILSDRTNIHVFCAKRIITVRNSARLSSARCIDKTINSIGARRLGCSERCVRATLEARDCTLNVACERLPPLPSSRPRPH